MPATDTNPAVTTWRSVRPYMDEVVQLLPGLTMYGLGRRWGEHKSDRAELAAVRKVLERQDLAGRLTQVANDLNQLLTKENRKALQKMKEILEEVVLLGPH